MNSKLGVAEDPHKGNMSMRSNVIIDKVLTPYFYYETLQHNGCMLIAENAHLAGQPAQAVQNAYNTILTNINYIKLQRGLLPQYLLSDDVVVDLDAGLMWYAVLQPEAKYGDASQRAADFTYSAGYSTTWDDWRLPTDSEMRVLRDRGRLIAVTSSVNQRDSSVAHDGNDASQGNYGYSAQGLPIFGFRGLSALNSDGECWCDDWTYRVGDTGRNYWHKTSNEEFRLNHQDNDTYNLTALNTSKRPYFLVRTISVNGSPPLVANDTFLGPSDPNNQPPALFGRDCTNAEYLTMGTLDHFNFVDVYDPGPREGDYVDDSLNNTVDVNGAFQIAMGGSVTLGTGVTTSYSFTTASYSENAYQEQNPSTVPLRMHGITAYWGGNSSSVDNPDHSKVDVTPDAEIDWHGTGSQQSAPITAQAYSTSGTLVTKTSTVTAVNSTTPFLKSISMFPRNRKYDTAGSRGVVLPGPVPVAKRGLLPVEVSLPGRGCRFLAGRLLDGVVDILIQVGSLPAEVVFGLLPVATKRFFGALPRGVIIFFPPFARHSNYHPYFRIDRHNLMSACPAANTSYRGLLVPRAWGWQTWEEIDYRVTKVFESPLLAPAVHCTHLVANEKGIPIEDRLTAVGLDDCRLIRRGASAST